LYKPVLTEVQLVPLFVERKTSPSGPPEIPVPAKRFSPETARAKTSVNVKPLLTEVQLVPLFVERKTPLLVPAKRFVPETAKEEMLPPVGPLV
jgi:hypothetical protein